MKNEWLKVGDRVCWTNMPKPYAEGTVVNADDWRFEIRWDKDNAKASFSWNNDHHISKVKEPVAR